MNLISDEWREQNALLHQSDPTFGSKASMRRARALRQWMYKFGAETVLDYGCGKGWLGRHLGEPFRVSNYDPAIPEFAALPSPADMVVCWDVLEHVEPPALGDVLDHLRSLAPAASLAIGLDADRTRPMPDGRNPHLIQRPPEWWMLHLRRRWPRMVGKFRTRSLEVVCFGEC